MRTASTSTEKPWMTFSEGSLQAGVIRPVTLPAPGVISDREGARPSVYELCTDPSIEGSRALISVRLLLGAVSLAAAPELISS